MRVLSEVICTLPVLSSFDDFLSPFSFFFPTPGFSLEPFLARVLGDSSPRLLTTVTDPIAAFLCARQSGSSLVLDVSGFRGLLFLGAPAPFAAASAMAAPAAISRLSDGSLFANWAILPFQASS